MTDLTASNRYSGFARVLHWIIAALIVGQYLLAELASLAREQDALLKQLALLANHKSIGISILMLATLRVAWRLTHSPPPMPASVPDWQSRVAGLMHVILYVLLFALPLTGWLMSSAKAFSVSWFNLFVLPDLIGADARVAELLILVHELLAKALVVIAGIHILAALKHQFFDKDQVLGRILGWRTGVLFVTLIVAVGWGAGTIRTGSSSDQPSPGLAEVENGDKTASKNSDLPLWNIDYSRSHIRFTGDQAGAPFQGEWQNWTAKIQFDAQRLPASKFDVTIDVSSVATGDEERDGYILGDAFFNQAVFGRARFVADQFAVSADGFTAKSRLTMKGTTLPTDFDFSVQSQTSGERELVGHARLDRLAWNIGEGEWTDTSWVGQYVEVEVIVVATIEQNQ